MSEGFEESMRRLRGDAAFRAKLRAEPAAALAEQGVDVRPGIEFRVVEDSADVRHFVLPPARNSRLPDDMLRAVVGGTRRIGGFEVSDTQLWLLRMLLQGRA